MYLISGDAQAAQLLSGLLSRRLRSKNAYNCLHSMSPLSCYQETWGKHKRGVGCGAYAHSKHLVPREGPGVL